MTPMTEDGMTTVAARLAEWAVAHRPDDDDLALAERSLRDTMAVTAAARGDALRPLTAHLGAAGRLAALGHVLDFDDLHMESTTHISTVCVPAVLGTPGEPGSVARAYLAAAGVMARLGTALGWEHYSSGWHATCAAGAPAAAAGAAVRLGLDAEGIARAMALAVPAAGGVQQAFGTAGKALQVGFAADAGVRAAHLAAAGATADPRALTQWLRLVGGDPDRVDTSGPAVPGGLAVKMFPCCYAMQRPISAVRELPAVRPDEVTSVVVRTPEGTTQPLIHHDPGTGLQAKFSLEYAVAAALLDGRPGFASFTDDAVRRPAARRLLSLVRIEHDAGGDQLLAGEVRLEVHRGGDVVRGALRFPPGSPSRPPDGPELSAKIADCAPDLAAEISTLTWSGAADFVRDRLPAAGPDPRRRGSAPADAPA
ncbi:2-methylcitrate dehydratase PrpD [Spinactinospora alkalitolerans]|uniref:2-methylcitrate dehydratase PrpD n=1 Tax=Spinactinospora alkalitolerans TaxID=687207 RepID=A0A852TUV3_9ACTN|nr:MmgE/PrpD family protein [Spinactinospora alkalitolerans]NYE48226.1 2-methylcitrate dehydratase PrpD [Spinactinospora alkalitolerans]